MKSSRALLRGLPVSGEGDPEAAAFGGAAEKEESAVL